MRLITITGMLHQPKAGFTRALIEMLSAETDRLALLDNSDLPLAIDGVTRQRLAGGCVCCSLATILDSLRSERVQIATVSLIDTLTRVRNPYLTRKLESYSDVQVYEPFDFPETVHAAIGAPL